ncbi:MAG: TIGR03960 family B12-binding radical SAM protein [Candidatus Omnitrophota bacterium]
MGELREILDRVIKPARYIGCEINSVRKRFDGDKVSVVLAYPDIYEVGMSYLGIRILYHLLNERDDVLCERVFAPWDDMERELVNSGRRLFSLESKTDINKFDIVGFSLSYELTYTNVLNMLHLGGITVRSAERGDDEPLVIAGGACCYNPEPMSEFIDAFIIGDGEEALPGFIEAYRKAREKNAGRKSILRLLAGLEGVYIPALYETAYSGGRFQGLRPRVEGAPGIIKKALVADLENAYYPVKQIVPVTRIIHDRIAVEVMRGCPNMCRFCQAGVINRPVRLRSPERVRAICRETYKHTGYENIALLSLSSVNYPYLVDLVKGINHDFTGKGVGISVPSLRVDEAFYDLPEMLSAIHKSTLTFAPETANDTMRRSLGKNIDLRILCKSASLAYEHGWRSLKLYFMVGFPGEPEDEAREIIALARQLSELRKKTSKGAAEIKVSVNPFTPKAHTPLQWLGMKGPDELLKIKRALTERATKKIKVDFPEIERSLLEACLSRGDRKTSEVIFSAWRKGAKMDSWRDFFRFDIWKRSFQENGLDLYSCAGRAYSVDDALPWGHIDAGTGGDHLKREFIASGFFAG